MSWYEIVSLVALILVSGGLTSALFQALKKWTPQRNTTRMVLGLGPQRRRRACDQLDPGGRARVPGILERRDDDSGKCLRLRLHPLGVSPRRPTTGSSRMPRQPDREVTGISLGSPGPLPPGWSSRRLAGRSATDRGRQSRSSAVCLPEEIGWLYVEEIGWLYISST